MANRNLHLSEEKLDALRSEYKQRNWPLKYTRSKTKPEYQQWYPWLLLDDKDAHFVFCTVCECRLSAKRSDLGKHEASNKHRENEYRKRRLAGKEETDCDCETTESRLATTTGTSNLKWKDDDEQYTDDNLDIKSELCDTDEAVYTGDANEHQVEANEHHTEATQDDNNNDDDDDEEDADDETTYEPSKKRFASDSDSQHSGLLEYLPLQVTINESPTNVTQLPLPIGGMQQLGNSAMYQQSPCRITIKKVTAPVIKPVLQTQPNEITTKATITPIANNYTLTQAQHLQQQQQQQQLSKQTQHQPSTNLSCTAVALPPARDSFDLFFDSICATVKALPPKLATEGKMRVMQLIGELEMRAINEREAQQNNSSLTLNVAAATTASTKGQQISTVASTTR